MAAGEQWLYAGEAEAESHQGAPQGLAAGDQIHEISLKASLQLIRSDLFLCLSDTESAEAAEQDPAHDARFARGRD